MLAHAAILTAVVPSVVHTVTQAVFFSKECCLLKELSQVFVFLRCCVVSGCRQYDIQSQQLVFESKAVFMTGHFEILYIRRSVFLEILSLSLTASLSFVYPFLRSPIFRSLASLGATTADSSSCRQLKSCH
jgi:hypothetical protein